MAALTTNVYIDGFNLYYGAVKGTKYRWLDVGALCRRLLPSDENDIRCICYYTSLVKARPHDPDQPIRQQVYRRALRTIPILQVHFGHFLASTARGMLTDGSGSLATVRVEREKGSDVNLASHLVRDGFRGDYQCAVIISNDTDLLEPIRIVREDLGKRIGVICPHGHPHADLQAACHFCKSIWPSALKACQFSPDLADAAGTFSKPRTW